MFTNTCEPSIPKQAHTKADLSSFQSSKDTTALINDASTISHIPSTRVSSTIMAGNNSVYNNKSKDGSEHESISIKNRVPIKSIRIERDYTLGDGITRFYTEYPKDLEGRITSEVFVNTIQEINKRMDYADRLSWRVVFENIMETLSIYLWPIFFSTHYQRAIKALHVFIDSENQLIYHPQYLSISDPVKSAFLFVGTKAACVP
ncbi:hypothetical protein G6F33_004944 [Rhizopus arrhizus]|nr:hypothetical protein G6F33_004944 [Rhizopus arrhizus]